MLVVLGSLRHSSRRRVRNSTSTPDFGASGRMSAKFAQCLHSSANCARRTGGSISTSSAGQAGEQGYDAIGDANGHGVILLLARKDAVIQNDEAGFGMGLKAKRED